jgi:hypothetical protein
MSRLSQGRIGSILVVFILACSARNRSPEAEPPSFAQEHAAVQVCATSVAVGEGWPGTTSKLPSDSIAWVEWLVLRVRMTPDSALPEATVRRAQHNGRRYYPLSSKGRRIQDRVNEECRLARTASW